jgi:autotransporter-associated beta strand protein
VTVTVTSTIDTNGFDVGINSSISGAGGFVKTGAGRLSLGGTNSFTDGMAVLAGTLSLASNLTLDDSIILSLASGTTLDLAFASGSETLGGLLLDGVAVAPGTYTAAELDILGASASIDFTSTGGTLTVVPEPGVVTLIGAGLMMLLLLHCRRRPVR